ncbi:hypothetical protein [Ruminococcus albus]|uniref:hypothetical protein n=1 Tax=Ruminococcus albus TaxID=1264 RepID=UPI00111412A1|nr:hypothetical protein [Ruminococcus albus]
MRLRKSSVMFLRWQCLGRGCGFEDSLIQPVRLVLDAAAENMPPAQDDGVTCAAIILYGISKAVLPVWTPP